MPVVFSLTLTLLTLLFFFTFIQAYVLPSQVSVSIKLNLC